MTDTTTMTLTRDPAGYDHAEIFGGFVIIVWGGPWTLVERKDGARVTTKCAHPVWVSVYWPVNKPHPKWGTDGKSIVERREYPSDTPRMEAALATLEAASREIAYQTA